MEVSAREDVTVVVVEFAAPVPAGNEVLVISLEKSDSGFFDVSSAEIVVDLSARVAYADYAYWSVLAERGWPSAPVADDPVAPLGDAWKRKRSLHGRVAGALLSSRDGGDQNHIRTLLHVLPEVEKGYRG